MTYTINYVRALRLQERRAEHRSLLTTVLVSASFGILVLAGFFAVLQVMSMRDALALERENLERIKAEYRKYRETRMTVTKADVELLDRLQQDRVYWTRVLAALARKLPDHYWLTSMEYRSRALEVDGFGYISREQKQLITLDDYLNGLRADPVFAGVISGIRIKEVERRDEERRQRVGFTVTGARN